MSEKTTAASTPSSMGDADLQALVAQLLQRVESLESEVNDLRSAQAVPEDVVTAIGAAVAAYLGCKAKVRAIHLTRGNRWGTEERAVQHNRAVTRTR